MFKIFHRWATDDINSTSLINTCMYSTCTQLKGTLRWDFHYYTYRLVNLIASIIPLILTNSRLKGETTYLKTKNNLTFNIIIQYVHLILIHFYFINKNLLILNIKLTNNTDWRVGSRLVKKINELDVIFS